MTWLAWRQLRAGAMAAAAGVMAAAVALAVQEHAFSTAPPAATWVRSTELAVVVELLLMILVPAVLGMFIGAPLVAGEVETGTHRLAWAQSVSRRRWLLVKLSLAMGAALLAAALLAAAATWGLAPWIDQNQRVGNPGWFSDGTFDAVGVVPVAYALFAVALGVAAGAVTRRTLVAMFVVIVAFAGVRLAVNVAVRPHYQPPLSASAAVDRSGDLLRSLNRSGANMVSMLVVDGRGRAVDDCSNTGCAGYRVVVDYQPGDRFWTFQWMEAGLYAGLGVLLLGATWVAVMRRVT